MNAIDGLQVGDWIVVTHVLEERDPPSFSPFMMDAQTMRDMLDDPPQPQRIWRECDPSINATPWCIEVIGEPFILCSNYDASYGMAIDTRRSAVAIVSREYAEVHHRGKGCVRVDLEDGRSKFIDKKEAEEQGIVAKQQSSAAFCSFCGSALKAFMRAGEGVWRMKCTNPECGRTMEGAEINGSK